MAVGTNSHWPAPSQILNGCHHRRFTELPLCPNWGVVPSERTRGPQHAPVQQRQPGDEPAGSATGWAAARSRSSADGGLSWSPTTTRAQRCGTPPVASRANYSTAAPDEPASSAGRIGPVGRSRAGPGHGAAGVVIPAGGHHVDASLAERTVGRDPAGRRSGHGLSGEEAPGGSRPTAATSCAARSRSRLAQGRWRSSRTP